MAASAAHLEQTLGNYVKKYNHLIPQRALNHVSPAQALKNWQAKRPELFVNRAYNQPGLDSYGSAEPHRDSQAPTLHCLVQRRPLY